MVAQVEHLRGPPGCHQGYPGLPVCTLWQLDWPPILLGASGARHADMPSGRSPLHCSQLPHFSILARSLPTAVVHLEQG